MSCGCCDFASKAMAAPAHVVVCAAALFARHTGDAPASPIWRYCLSTSVTCTIAWHAGCWQKEQDVCRSQWHAGCWQKEPSRRESRSDTTTALETARLAFNDSMRSQAPSRPPLLMYMPWREACSASAQPSDTANTHAHLPAIINDEQARRRAARLHHRMAGCGHI